MGANLDDIRTELDAQLVDVLVLDIRLGLRLLQTELPEPRPAVVVLSGFDFPQYARSAMELGAAGFVGKDAPVEELVETIRSAASGALRFPAIVQAEGVHLTPRERDVLRLVCDGRSNDEIAGALSISPRTVETYLQRMFSRLEVASRTELATRAVQEGLLDIPPQGSAASSQSLRLTIGIRRNRKGGSVPGPARQALASATRSL